jgi:hypothetical protein
MSFNFHIIIEKRYLLFLSLKAIAKLKKGVTPSKGSEGPVENNFPLIGIVLHMQAYIVPPEGE